MQALLSFVVGLLLAESSLGFAHAPQHAGGDGQVQALVDDPKVDPEAFKKAMEEFQAVAGQFKPYCVAIVNLIVDLCKPTFSLECVIRGAKACCDEFENKWKYVCIAVFTAAGTAIAAFLNQGDTPEETCEKIHIDDV